MTNKVRVEIAGSVYTVRTADTEEYVSALAQKVDEDIDNLITTNANLTVTRAAVFCSLDYLDEYKKSAANANNMRNQIRDYLADAEKAKDAAEAARCEVERLECEVERLKREIAYLKERRNG